MNDESKHRLTGAVVWLLLLVIIVPTWYNNPVNFTPNQVNTTALSNPAQPVAEEVYLIPQTDNEPIEYSVQPLTDQQIKAQETLKQLNAEKAAEVIQTSPMQETELNEDAVVQQLALPKLNESDQPKKSVDKQAQTQVNVEQVKPDASEKKVSDSLPKQAESDEAAETKSDQGGVELLSGHWIVRVAAYRSKRTAENFAEELKSIVEVKAFIKKYEKSGFHSVRTGPYLNFTDAEADKQKIDRLMHTQSEVVQVK